MAATKRKIPAATLPPPTSPEIQDSVIRLSKDLREAAKTMNTQEARYLVDMYYQMQDNRTRAGRQIGAMQNEPHVTLAFFEHQAMYLESQIKRALDAYTDSSDVGRWCKSICGIGPVITAGMLAHIDITRCPTAGHIWSFAGQDPTKKWNKGEKRPWNAKLKRLCWLMGESFVKVKARESDVYGKLYEVKKAEYVAKNEAGGYADRAKQILSEKNFRGDTLAKAAYEKGKLPDGHIHAMAKRYAVKIFLSHFHHVAYRAHYGVNPPKPFAIAILGHAHMIDIPNLIDATRSLDDDHLDPDD